MTPRRRHMLGALAAALPWPARASLNWDDLVPSPTPQDDDDPFARLSGPQFDALREIAALRLLAQRLGPRSELVGERQRQLARALQMEGIDADAMLAKREQLIAERRARADAVVMSVDGAPIRLAGWPVHLSTDADGMVREFLLVPQAGACSHKPPPPANQVLRVRLATAGMDPATVGHRWLVSGTVRVRRQTQAVMMVDGVVEVTSGYAIEDAAAVPLDGTALTVLPHFVR